MSGGMDKIEQSIIAKALQECLDKIMSGRPDRKAYIMVVAADGPHAMKGHAHTRMNNVVAHQFADAIEHEADEVRAAAKRGLDATLQAQAERRRIDQGNG